MSTTNAPFLEKVRLEAHLKNTSEAKDVAETVFRAMRQLMTTEAINQVGEELHETAELIENKALEKEITDLWKDTNPVASFSSQIEAPIEVDSDTFFYQIVQETNLPEGVTPETVVKAVFFATKEKLSSDRVEEVGSFLPDKIRQLWEQS